VVWVHFSDRWLCSAAHSALNQLNAVEREAAAFVNHDLAFAVRTAQVRGAALVAHSAARDLAAQANEGDRSAQVQLQQVKRFERAVRSWRIQCELQLRRQNMNSLNHSEVNSKGGLR